MVNNLTQILRKRIKSVIVGEKEYVENKFYKKNVLNSYEVSTLDDYGCDVECAFDEGLSFDKHGELLKIDVSKLLNSMAGFFEAEDENCSKSHQHDVFETITDKLREWHGYILWV